MRILLIKPRTFLESSVISSAESLLPPLGILYIAAMLKKNKHTVKFVDLDFDEQKLEHMIHAFKPDWVGITSSSPSFPYAMGAVRRIKAATSVPVVFGGVHVTSVGPKLLEKYPEIDFLVMGEGEYAMRDLVAGKDPSSIPGVCFRSPTGIVAKEMTFVDNLDDIPVPARELTRQYAYRDSPLYRRSEAHATILFSRGCVHKCIFCDYHTRGKPRFRSAHAILAEMSKLYRQGITDFRVLDEFFTMNRPLVKKICEGILKRKLKVSWNCQTRADGLDEEMIILMKKAGCWNIQIGVETGSPRVMEKIHKQLDFKRVEETVRLLRKHGLFIVCFFMMGFPFETRKDIEMSIAFARKLDPDMVTFSMVTPFPATDLWLVSGLDQFDEPTLRKLGIFSDKSYFLKKIDMAKMFHKAIHTFYFRPISILRLLGEATLHGTVRRRIDYMRALMQGAAI